MQGKVGVFGSCNVDIVAKVGRFPRRGGESLMVLGSSLGPGEEQVASLSAIQNFGGFLGAALAPVITGIILDATGQFTNVFILGGCLLLSGACLYGFFVRKPLTQ